MTDLSTLTSLVTPPESQGISAKDQTPEKGAGNVLFLDLVDALVEAEAAPTDTEAPAEPDQLADDVVAEAEDVALTKVPDVDPEDEQVVSELVKGAMDPKVEEVLGADKAAIQPPQTSDPIPDRPPLGPAQHAFENRVAPAASTVSAPLPLALTTRELPTHIPVTEPLLPPRGKGAEAIGLGSSAKTEKLAPEAKHNQMVDMSLVRSAKAVIRSDESPVPPAPVAPHGSDTAKQVASAAALNLPQPAEARVAEARVKAGEPVIQPPQPAASKEGKPVKNIEEPPRLPGLGDKAGQPAGPPRPEVPFARSLPPAVDRPPAASPVPEPSVAHTRAAGVQGVAIDTPDGRLHHGDRIKATQTEPQGQTVPTPTAPAPASPQISQIAIAQPAQIWMRSAGTVLDLSAKGTVIEDSPLSGSLLGQVGSMPQSSVLAAPVAPQTPPAVAQSVARQIAASVTPLPNGPVEISLSPEELGRVRLTVTAADGSINVAIQADRPETADLMRRHIETLMREFKEMGYQHAGFSFEGSGGDGSEDHTRASADDSTLRVAPADDPDTTNAPAPTLSDAGLDLRI